MVDLLHSPLLTAQRFLHGSATRAGGVSLPPFDSANFGGKVGDEPEAVAENHRLLMAAIGYRRLFTTSQVHGAVVLDVTDLAPDDAKRLEADASFTRRPGDAVGVRTADCVPILVGDARSGAALAVHAGWRGVAQRILRASVERLLGATGSGPTDLWAAIGPHIRGPRFEVGEDVAVTLEGVAEGAPIRVGVSSAGKPLIDLTAAVVAQLTVLGVPRAQIEDLGGCTLDDGARFFSFRRDGARSGRHLSVIAAR